MAKIKYSILFAAFCLALASCKLQKLQKNLNQSSFKMDQEVMEVLGDSIQVSFKGTIPPKAFPKKGTAKVNPYIQYGNSELPLKPMSLQGESAKGGHQVISYKDGGTFTYSDKILYTPELKKSTLRLNATIRIKYADEAQDRCLTIASNVELAKGTITTSLTQRDKDDIIISNENFDAGKVDPKTYYSKDKFENEKSVIKSANSPTGYVGKKGDPTISTMVSGIVDGDKVVPQKPSTGPEGYYVNNNANLDKIFDPSNPLPQTDKKAGTNNDGYSVLGNKYKIGSKYMVGTAATGTQSSNAVNTNPKYDPASPKNIKYFGALDVSPKMVNKTAVVYYVLDTWNYRDNYQSNNTELQELTKFAANPRYTINGILIHSFASPEGGKGRNTTLSDERTNATFNEVKKEFKKAGVNKTYDDDYYLRSSTFEDWEGWRRGIASTNLPDGAEMLSIVNSNLDDDAKEAKIKAEHAASYKIMKEDILPKLRRSVVAVNATIPNRTPAEIVETAKTNMMDLNEKELLYYAMVSSDDKEREKAYRTYVTKVPSEWIGYSDLAAVLIREKKTKEAITFLEKADKISPNNPFIYNNLGVAYKDLKEYDKSEMYIMKAKAAGVPENNNLGNLYARKGMYKEALTYYGNDVSYNVALAQTLSGDYAGANKTLDAVESDDRLASNYYLKSIVGARSGNAEAMGTNLRMAIEKDPSYRETAKGDLEFRKFYESPEFKAAIR
jgi:tetratricopeptide (TPR) repeat protein